MSPGLRKLLLTVHVASTVGWVGAVAVFAVLAVTALTTSDPELATGAQLAMDLSARLVIVPLSMASVISGVVQGLRTSWGLFRHYWVVVKLVVTLFATAILLLKVPVIAELADAARGSSSGDVRNLRMELVLHSVGGLLVLLVPLVLSIYKPRGMTRYGARKQREERERVRREALVVKP